MLAIALILVSTPSWRTLEAGLDFAELEAPTPSFVGDSKVRVLRIDPTRFDLELLMASAAERGKALTARQWSDTRDAVAAINPSMFDTDKLSSVGLMRSRTHANNPRKSKDKAFLVFDPVANGAPVRIVDPSCDSVPKTLPEYHSVVQSIRMVSCKRRNTWTQQQRKWSAALVGLDGAGRVLFIHVRSPYTMHDLVDMLLALPIDLRQLMYGEGGPEAQMFVQSGGHEIELVGSYETDFNENDDNTHAWPVPNVLAVVRRAP